MSRKEIRIAGFGGQGIVLSGLILGKAASIFNKGFATLSQSYGPESRGGSCRAEVITSTDEIDYPYIISPQLQIILSQDAYNEFGKNAPPGTLLITDSELVKTNTSKDHTVLSIPASRMAQELGRAVVANIIMLGFLAAVSDVVSKESLVKSIMDSIPAGTEEFNMKAFDLGYNYGIKHVKKVEHRNA